MPSHLKDADQLDAIAADIHRLRRELVDRERRAGELLDGEDAAAMASEQAAATRMLLDAAKDRYFEVNEAAREKKCAIHGEALVVVCPDCVAAWSFTATRVA